MMRFLCSKSQWILQTVQDDRGLQIILLLSSIAALSGAYISQYVFGLQPCILCLHQRKPFFAIVVLTVVSLLLLRKTNVRKIITSLCALLLLINIGIASYHVGVEQKIFQGPTTCSSNNLNDLTDLEALKRALQETQAVKCSEPSFVFLGISMAGWNVIYCLMLLSFVIYSGKIRKAIPQ